MVELHVFAAYIRTHAHHVALGRGDDRQRVRLEEIGEGREFAALQPLHLDRPCKLLAVLETEARDHMRHARPVPIGQEKVERAQLRQIIDLARPALREIRIAAPVEIADIRHDEQIAVEPARRLARDIGREIGRCRRRDRSPPREQADEDRAECEKRPPTLVRENEIGGAERQKRETNCERKTQPVRRRRAEPQRERRPRARGRHDKQKKQQPAGYGEHAQARSSFIAVSCTAGSPAAIIEPPCAASPPSQFVTTPPAPSMIGISATMS